jgi:hypothetical protein
MTLLFVVAMLLLCRPELSDELVVLFAM